MRKINGYTLAEMRAEAKARITAREAESDRLIEQALNDTDLAAEITHDIENNNFQDMDDFEAFVQKAKEMNA
jgi:hypothetical protein